MKKLKHFKFAKNGYYKFINPHNEKLILHCLGYDKKDKVYSFTLLEIEGTVSMSKYKGDMVYYNRNINMEQRKKCKCYKLTKLESLAVSI